MRWILLDLLFGWKETPALLINLHFICISVKMLQYSYDIICMLLSTLSIKWWNISLSLLSVIMRGSLFVVKRESDKFLGLNNFAKLRYVGTFRRFMVIPNPPRNPGSAYDNNLPCLFSIPPFWGWVCLCPWGNLLWLFSILSCSVFARRYNDK